ncbi:MAG: hypothetical protein ACM3JD_09085 [Rudaea sp.]
MKPQLVIVLAFVIALLAGAGVVSAQSNTGAPSIKIVKPIPNGIVPEEQGTVQVSIENFTLDENHWWELYVDESPAATVKTGALTVAVPTLKSGPHEFRVTLADGHSTDLPAASVSVTAAPATPTGSPFNRAWMAPAMGVMILAILVLIGLSLRYTRRPAVE